MRAAREWTRLMLRRMAEGVMPVRAERSAAVRPCRLARARRRSRSAMRGRELPEVRGRRSEVGEESEVRGRRSEVRGEERERRSARTFANARERNSWRNSATGAGRKGAEVRGRRSEVSGESEVGGRRSEVGEGAPEA